MSQDVFMFPLEETLLPEVDLTTLTLDSLDYK